MPRNSDESGDGFWTEAPKNATAFLNGKSGPRCFIHIPAAGLRQRPGEYHPPQSPPMPEFTAHFERIVGPQLAERSRIQAAFIAGGLIGYAEGHAELMGHALRMGAAYLPDDAFDGLTDWIDTTLLQQIDRADRVRAEIEQQAHDDPPAFWSGIWRPIWAKRSGK